MSYSSKEAACAFLSLFVPFSSPFSSPFQPTHSSLSLVPYLQYSSPAYFLVQAMLQRLTSSSLLVILLTIISCVISWSISKRRLFSSLQPPSRETLTFPFENATPLTISRQDRQLLTRLSVFNKHVIDDYVEWHSATRALYEQDYKRHVASWKTIPPPEFPRALIFMGDDGSYGHGLGDRFRALFSAYLHAALSKRLLLVKWNKPIPLSLAFTLDARSNFSFDERFDPHRALRRSRTWWNVSQPSGELVSYDYINDMHWLHANETVLFYKGFKKMNYSLLFQQPPESEYAPVLNQPLVQHMKQIRQELSSIDVKPLPCHFLPLVMSVMFRPTSFLRSRFAMLQNQRSLQPLFNGNGEKVKYLAVHARLGRIAGEVAFSAKRFNVEKARSSLENITSCLTRGLANMSSSLGLLSQPAPVFLATDSTEIRPTFASSLRDDVSINVRMAYADIDVVHVVALKKTTDESRTTYVDTYFDLLLMSNADGIVYLKSGFASLGTYMGGVCEETSFEMRECANLIVSER